MRGSRRATDRGRLCGCGEFSCSPPADIIKALTEQDSRIASRQFGIVDLQGWSAGYSGSGNGKVSLDAQGEAAGTPIVFSIQGNILAKDEVVGEAVKAFPPHAVAIRRTQPIVRATRGWRTRCAARRSEQVVDILRLRR